VGGAAACGSWLFALHAARLNASKIVHQALAGLRIVAPPDRLVSDMSVLYLTMSFVVLSDSLGFSQDHYIYRIREATRRYAKYVCFCGDEQDRQPARGEDCHA
jgi:hypothetical protein